MFKRQNLNTIHMYLIYRVMGKIPIRYLDPKVFFGRTCPMGNPLIASGSYQETCSGCSVPVLDFLEAIHSWNPFPLIVYL